MALGLRILRTALVVAAVATAGSAVTLEERFFGSAKIALGLVGSDSLTVTVIASSEDLMNTVGVFPIGEGSKPKNFRHFEERTEAYLKQRVPVWADRNRLDLGVKRWKPGGKGRTDGLDSASINVDDLVITLGARLPRGTKALSIRADMWVERSDAAETTIEYTLSRGDRLLRRQWARTEKTLTFPLHPDTLARWEREPKPPSQEDPHSHHGH